MGGMTAEIVQLAIAPAVAPRTEPWLAYVVVGSGFVAFALYAALLATGSLARPARWRIGLAIVAAALAVVLAPLAFFHDLPLDWQTPTVFATVANASTVLLGAALALPALRRAPLLATLGAAAFIARAALAWTLSTARDTLGIALERGLDDAADVALLVGLGAFALAYVRSARASTAPDAAPSA